MKDKEEILKLLKKAKAVKKAENIKEAIGILEDAKKQLQGEEGSKQSRRNETSGDEDEIIYLHKYGNILYEIGEYRRALKYYEELVEQHPSVNTHKALGDCLRKLNLYQEAFERYKVALEEDEFNKSENSQNYSSADEAAVLNSRGLTYMVKATDPNSYGPTYTPKMDNKKALKDFEKAIEISKSDNPNPLYHCNKGVILYILGRKEQGLESFKEAQKLVKEDKVEGLTKQNIDYIEETLKHFIELKGEVDKIKDKFKAIQREVSSKQLLELQENYDKLMEDYNETKERFNRCMLNQEDINSQSKTSHEELTEKMNLLKIELDQVKQDIKVVEDNISGIEQQMTNISSELKTKLDDNAEIFKNLKSLATLSDEEKKKIEDYYKAFVGTIAAAYVTAQVVNSEKVELQKSLIVKLVSIGCSFIPLVSEATSQSISAGSIPLSALISGISSIGEKLFSETGDTIKQKTIIRNARKIIKLATDHTVLSQKISKAAIQIVQDKDKQKQILDTTLVSLGKQPTTLLDKAKKMFKDLGKKYDEAMHGKVYSTEAELLGKKDAKNVLKEYLKLDGANVSDFIDAFELLITGCWFYVDSNDIHNICRAVSKGSYTDSLKKLFSEKYLESKLKESLKPLAISPIEISKAQMITFKLLCMIVQEARDQDKAIECIKDFAAKYPDLLKQVANEHPEYFGTKKIAEQVITDKQTLDEVLERTSNFTGGI